MELERSPKKPEKPLSDFDHDVFSHQVNYQKLTQDLLLVLRGDRAQVDMDRLLGHQFNQWHKWESGQKKFRWKDWVKVNQALGYDLPQLLESFLGQDVSENLQGFHIFNQFRTKFGNLNLHELSRFLETHPSKLRRLLANDQDLEFSLFLKFLGNCSRVLPAFIEPYSSSRLNPLISRKVKSYSIQRNLEAQFPWLASLEAALELRDYKSSTIHSDVLLANLTGLPVSSVRVGLKLLQDNEAITWSNNKFHLVMKRIDMESPSLFESAQLARHWTEKSLQRFETPDGVPQSKKGFAYRIYPASKKSQQQILEKARQFVGDIHRILNEDADEPKESIDIFLLHMFSLDELSSSNSDFEN